MIELIAQVELDSWVNVANIAGSIIVVILFLKFLSQERVARSKEETERLQTLKHINDGCHTHSQQLTKQFAETIAKNNAQLSENTRVLGRAEKVLDEFEGQG